MRMLCGQSNPLWHYAAGKYADRVGLLLGPSYFKKQSIRPWMPYALDNDAFTTWTKGTPWSEQLWLEMLQLARLNSHKPMWVLVPDVVADRMKTLAQYVQYAPMVAAHGFQRAFAVQDGMTAADVPADASIVFVGGTDAFKWGTLHYWSERFPRIHVGRVNNIEKVWLCDDLGVESVDGTGWFHDPTREDKLPALQDWMAGKRPMETMEIQL